MVFVSHTKNADFSEGVVEGLNLETGERKIMITNWFADLEAMFASKAD